MSTDDAPPPAMQALPDGTLQLSGAWTLAHAPRLDAAVRHAPRAATIDASGIERLDSAGAFQLQRLLAATGIGRERVQLADAQAALLDLVAANCSEAAPAPRPRARPARDLLAHVGRSTTDILGQGRQLLGFLGLVLATLSGLLLRPWRLRITPTVHHMEQAGFDAVPLVCLLNFLVGAVIAYLGANVLREFGAEIYVVELVSVSFLREFGVLLTAILLAGRTASAFTAQIGSMKSREEIDAIRTLGLDPIELLVVPRLLALLVMLPLLSFLATIAGLLGGMAVGSAELGVSNEVFLGRFEETFRLRHMLVGLAKAPIFALVIALIGCLEGFKVAGTAQSVGERTTSSVVQAIFLVVLLDALAAVYTMEMGW